MFNKQATTDTHGQQSYNHEGRGCGGFFGKKFANRFGGSFEGKGPWANAFGGFGNRKAANIEETETAFVISLYAAGLNKKDFNISATGDVLTIKYTAPQAVESDAAKFAHQEYQPSSFERSFQLNGKVLTDNINATYIDGVLKVSLPKNPETNRPAQQVKVD